MFFLWGKACVSSSTWLLRQFQLAEKYPGDVAPGPRQSGDVAARDRIEIDRDHRYRDCAGRVEGDLQRGLRPDGNEQVDIRLDQVGRLGGKIGLRIVCIA